MTATVILFEDHSWLGFRPLSAGQPTWEQRCGIFNTRERCELAGATGALLGRGPALDLVTAPRWDRGPQAVAALPDAGGPVLWLNGRLAPSATLVTGLLALPADLPSFVWRDGDGVVAARMTRQAALGAAADWAAWSAAPTGPWAGPGLGATAITAVAGLELACPADTAAVARARLAAALEAAAADAAPALRRAWDIVPATSGAIRGDLEAARSAGSWTRHPFGLCPAEGNAVPWAAPTRLARAAPSDLPTGCWLQGDDLWLADAVTLAPGCVIDSRRGPVVLDHGVDVAPHTLLEGPLYLGPGCRVKAGARIYGDSSFGIGNRLAGEIGESTFGDFSNKQHEGFIGHAVLGAWVNLGAMTTCSDLKNNYGNVRVDLGGGSEDTGQRFVGLMAGDHVKTAIGTLFNTGTTVGFASNIFGAGMPPKYVPAFSWGGDPGAPAYGVGQALATATVVMGRRGCRFEPSHRAMFEVLAAGA